MSFKQKNRTIKSFILPVALILFFGSCITSNNVQYSDPNYLQSDEFSTYENLNIEDQGESESNDTTVDSNTDYTTNDYYDYSFSSRIRRFHRPIYYSGYYGSIYTDYYWYNNDPFYCGTSIYYGYNWLSPYYSFYSYSPYYFDYYTPYYYGGHYTYTKYGYGYGQQYVSHNNNYNAFITGNRGSGLSSSRKGRGVNLNAPNKILSNTTNRISNIKSSKNTVRKSTIENRNQRSISTIKSNENNLENTTIRNNSVRNNSTIKTNKRTNSNNISNTKTNRNNRSYSTNRSSNKSYNSNNRTRSTRGGGKRSVKPRR